MQSLRRLPILVMVAALVGLGLFGTWVYQSNQSVSADPPLTEFISTDDHYDNLGTGHKSRVRYSRTFNPFRATVHWVEYGGRRASYWCGSGERWRHETTEYLRWSDSASAWVVQQSTTPGPWKFPQNVQLDYYNLYLTVIMTYSARVDDKLKYKHYNSCAGFWVEYSGSPHRHYLE